MNFYLFIDFLIKSNYTQNYNKKDIEFIKYFGRK